MHADAAAARGEPGLSTRMCELSCTYLGLGRKGSRTSDGLLYEQVQGSSANPS